MDFILPVLIFCFFTFLFIIYVLSHDDYVFLRKSISMEHIFNSVFLMGFSALFFARLIFVFLNPSVNYLNPLMFFLFTYFPGLSLTGAVTGMLVFIYFLNKKIPKGRLFDFSSIAFLGAGAFGFLILILIHIISDKFKNNLEFLIPFAYFVFFIVFLKVLLPIQKRGEFKEGTLGFLFLSFFSVNTFLVNLWSKKKTVFFIFGAEDIFLILLFIGSIILIIRQEKLLSKIKSTKK